MPLSHEIEFAALKEFFLDPLNPRLGLAGSESSPPQEHVLQLMRSWKLDELAVSFLESGFWPHEAVVVVEEEMCGHPCSLVVVEGNRRIAALTYLKDAFAGNPVSPTWGQIVEGSSPSSELFTRIPYILASSRDDVVAYLGFRHVTGIKQWAPIQKAEFIAGMIDDMGMSYEAVRKRIGMRRDTVRRNYIAYRILRQLDSLDIEISEAGVENRFSVLFLSLREESVRSFLGIDLKVAPEEARTPVPQELKDNLADFTGWLFGTETQRPLFADSRYVGSFARILANPQAVEYLRSSPVPNFDVALQKAGVEDEEVENQLKEASNQMELALSRVHLYRDSERIQNALRRLALNAKELVFKFPSIAEETGLQRSESNDA